MDEVTMDEVTMDEVTMDEVTARRTLNSEPRIQKQV